MSPSTAPWTVEEDGGEKFIVSHADNMIIAVVREIPDHHSKKIDVEKTAANADLLAKSATMFDLLRMADLGLHPADDRGECLYSQCGWRKTARKIIESKGSSNHYRFEGPINTAEVGKEIPMVFGSVKTGEVRLTDKSKKQRPISETMIEALRIMKKTGVRIAWDGYNRWQSPDGEEAFRADGKRCPTCTVSDALERRGLIERISPAGSTVYAITEKGKDSVP